MRKQLILLLFVTLCTAAAVNAQSTHSSLMFRNHAELVTPDLALNSSTKFHPNMAQVGYEAFEFRGDRESRRYQSAVHKKKAGTALLIVGASCLAGGATLLAFGIPGFNDDLNGNSSTELSPLAHIGEVVGGVILSAVGLGLSIPGAIMIAKGSRDARKYKAAQAVEP